MRAESGRLAVHSQSGQAVLLAIAIPGHAETLSAAVSPGLSSINFRTCPGFGRYPAGSGRTEIQRGDFYLKWHP